jgi:hypothetical protein
MSQRRITLQQLRKILTSFDVREDKSRGKGSHTMFFRDLPTGSVSYPMGTNSRDILPSWVKACRRALQLTPEDGVSDADFFSRA